MLTARLQDPNLNPLQPCIDLGSAADWLRVDIGYLIMSETALLIGQIVAAMERAETLCKQPLFSRPYYGFGSSFCDAALHSLNVTSVTAVHYQTDGSSDWTELGGTSYRWTESGEVTFSAAARLIANVSRIRVSYVAGYDVASVPNDILQAVRAMLAQAYDNRGDMVSERQTLSERYLKPYVLPIL